MLSTSVHWSFLREEGLFKSGESQREWAQGAVKFKMEDGRRSIVLGTKSLPSNNFGAPRAARAFAAYQMKGRGTATTVEET